MGILNDLITYLSKILTWWVMIQPWEQGLRIRLGNREKMLAPGVHFRIPFVDMVYVQTVRTRVSQIPIQTLTTADGKTVTISAAIRYAITDIKKLYHTFYHPEVTMGNLTMGNIAEFVAKHNLIECGPAEIERSCVPDLTENGISEMSIHIVGYAVVRTYRLLSAEGVYAPWDQLTLNAASAAK